MKKVMMNKTLVIVMNEIKDVLKKIKEIKKEIKIQENEKEKLNEEILMNNTRIGWLNEDVENMIFNNIAGALRVWAEDDHISIKYDKFNNSVNLQTAIDFAKKLDIEPKKISLTASSDEHLYLRINLLP